MDDPNAKDPDNPSDKITLLAAWKNKAKRTTDYWNHCHEEDGTDN
jgi:hypothetical protein